MQIPWELSEAIEAEATGIPPGELAPIVRDLTEQYRALEATDAGAREGPILTSDAHRAAYAVVRLPATFAAVSSALLALRERWPGFAPQSALDLGAGPGTAAWAACEVCPTLRSLTLVERDPGWIAMGRRWAERATHPALREARWLSRDLAVGLTAEESAPPSWQSRDATWTVGPAAAFDQHDLVMVSYMLGEIPREAREGLLDVAWRAAREAAVVIEPGTPDGFERTLQVRTQWVRRGGQVVAPCPHDAACPMKGTSSWCHFAERLARTRRHRLAKEATLGYEDEKYSYVFVCRESAGGIEGPGVRVIDRPHVEKGRIALPLCTRSGLETREVPRRDKPAYRRARKVRWGDWLPASPGEGR